MANVFVPQMRINKYPLGPSLVAVQSGVTTLIPITGLLADEFLLKTSIGTISGTSVSVTLTQGQTGIVTTSTGRTMILGAQTGGSAPSSFSLTGSPPTTATAGTAYTFTPGTSGGTAPITYALSAIVLPPGISFNTSTGQTSGVAR